MEPFTATSSRGPDLDLRHYVSALWRRKWLIVACVVVIGGAAFVAALLAPDQYRATGELLVTSQSTTSSGDTGLDATAERAVGNEVEIIGSQAVRNEVQRLIGDAPSVSASAKGETDIIRLTAEGSDPETVARVVNSYATAYETIRTQRVVDALEEEVEKVEAQQASTEAELTSLLAPINDLEQRIRETPPGPEQGDLFSQRDALNQQVGNERGRLFIELTELGRTEVDLRNEIANPVAGVEVLNEAKAPSEPFAPSPRRDGLVASAAGLLLGLGLALAWENLDDRLRDRESVKRAAPRIPVLVDIPVVGAWRRKNRSGLSVVHEPTATAAEAYRSLVTSIDFLRLGDRAVLHFTSAVPGEGKTTTTANVAAAFAEAGRAVVVVDADLRRPRLGELFGNDQGAGLSTVLIGDTDLSAAVRRTVVPGLDLLASGPVHPSPSELLRDGRMADVLTKLREQYDVVILDTPPVNPVSDGLILSALASGTILVVAAGTTRKRQLTRAMESLDHARANTVGIVFNAVPRSESHYYYDYSTSAS